MHVVALRGEEFNRIDTIHTLVKTITKQHKNDHSINNFDKNFVYAIVEKMQCCGVKVQMEAVKDPHLMFDSPHSNI